MAEEIKRIRVGISSELYRDDMNARFPVIKNTQTLIHRYVVGTDFTSSNNLRIDIDGAQVILFAMVKSPSNALKTIVETDLATETSDAARQGRSLTIGTSTTDLQAFIVYSV